MREIKSVGGLGSQFGGFAITGPAGGQAIGQRYAINKGADDEGHAVGVADFVHLDDARMFELSRCPRLAQEALLFVRIGDRSGAVNLDG